MLKILLLPLSLLYGIITEIRNFLYDVGILKTTEFDIPVVSVGNITVGGTGKTPHIEYLIDLISKKLVVATLSRGYKRKTSGFIIADENSTCSDIGDEPRQIKRKFPHIIVSVMANRVKGIKKLCNKFKELQVVLLDDAYQHRRVKAGISILLLDYNRPIHEDHLLPYGRLRECTYQKKRANIVIVTKIPADFKPIDRRILEKNLNLYPYQKLYFTTITYKNLNPVFESASTKTNKIVETNSFDDILLITGIANPQTIKDYLMPKCLRMHHLNFDDHHTFTKKDVSSITEMFNGLTSGNKIIITTEKDSVRLMEADLDPIVKQHLFYLPIEITFIHKDKEEFNKQIMNYVTSNKRNI